MGLAKKCNYAVVFETGGLIQNLLRMACDDELAAAFPGRLTQLQVNLSLPEYFEMSIRLVKQQNSALM